MQTYKSFSEVVWHGDLFRLADPREHDFASLMYVNEAQSRAVMFNYQVAGRYGTGSQSPVKLRGLQPGKRYAVKEVNLFPGTSSTLPKEAVYTGEFLMTVGFNPDVNTRRTSVVLEITQV